MTGEKSPATTTSKEFEGGASTTKTDDLARFESGTSVTGIRAEAFRKKAHPLSYCASDLTSSTNRKP